MGEIIASISNVMYSYILIIMLLGVGLYFTIRTKGVQLRHRYLCVCSASPSGSCRRSPTMKTAFPRSRL